MILTCDSCRKRFSVDDSAAGRRTQCPHCGHIQRAPTLPLRDDAPVVGERVAEEAPAPAAGGGDRTTRMRGPNDRLPPRTGPETTVMVVRPSVLRSRPGAALIVLAAILIGIVGGIYALVSKSQALAIVGGLVALVGIGTIIAWKIQSLGQTLQITTKRVVYRDGILGRRTQEMAHKVIQDMEVEQSFLERLCGVGHLTLSNSGQEDDEIHMPSVAGPHRVREIIDSYRNL